MKYTTDDIKLISLVEKVIRVGVKDYFEGEVPVFVIDQGTLRQALGPQAANVKRLSELLKKRVKIVEFNEDILRFVGNVVAPIKVQDIKQEGKIIMIYSADTKSRGFLIGRNANILRSNEAIVKHYFDIDEMKVV